MERHVAVSESIKEQARARFSALGPVRVKPMFGGAGVYIDETMFALIADEEIYLKVDDQTEDAFDAAGCEPFVYETKHGSNTSMRYRRLPEAALDDAEAALGWGRLALEAAFRARAGKRGGRKARPKSDPGLLISGPWEQNED